MPNRRDIEKRLSDLEGGDGSSPAGMEITIRNSQVMKREQAEREGREILGLSEEAAESGYVRVPAGTEEIRL